MTGTSQEQRRHVLDGFFGWVRGLGVRRNTDNKWVAGVCSGLAGRLGVDPVLVRGALLLLVFFGGFGLTVYLLAWALLPDRHDHIVAEGGIRHGEGWGIVLLVVIGVAVLSDLADRWWIWTILLPAAILLWWTFQSAKAGRTPEPPGVEAASATAPYAGSVAPHGMGPGHTGIVTRAPRVVRQRRRRAGVLGLLLTAGLALAAYGAGAQSAPHLSTSASPQVIGLASALGATGLSLVLIGLAGRRAGFTGLLATVLAVAAVLATTPTSQDLWGGMGNRTWIASSQPAGGFHLGMGDAKLDLTGAKHGDTVTATLGAGDLTITVPRSITATTKATVGAGNVTVRRADGTTVEGSGVGAHNDLSIVVGSGPTAVTLNAQLGAGDLTIIEEK